MSNIFLESMNANDSLSSLNDRGDLTRMAYSNKSSDIPLRNNSMTDRFESDTFINHKESFEQNNSRINSLKLKDSERYQNDNIRLRSENDSLKRELDMLKITGLEADKYKSENTLLKKKVLELSKADDNEVSLDESNNLDSVEKVPVDVTRLKSVLYNRLKSYHENHIESLILQYDLNEKTEIEKNVMEKILLEAIHV